MQIEREREREIERGNNAKYTHNASDVAHGVGVVRCLHHVSVCPTIFDCGMSMRCVKHAVAHVREMFPLPGQCCGSTLFDLCCVCAIYRGDVVAISLCNILFQLCLMLTWCVLESQVPKL